MDWPARSGTTASAPNGYSAGTFQSVFSRRDRAVVARQAVELGAEVAREALQLVERAGFLERLGVELDRGVRGVDAGAAAGASPWSRRACGALSVPRKNFGLPEVAASTSASRCSSRLSTGRQ